MSTEKQNVNEVIEFFKVLLAERLPAFVNDTRARRGWSEGVVRVSNAFSDFRMLSTTSKYPSSLDVAARLLSDAMHRSSNASL